jgi:hypothetical protein
LRRDMGPVDDGISQPFTVGPRNERRDLVTHIVGGKEQRQETRWETVLIPFFRANGSGEDKQGESLLNEDLAGSTQKSMIKYDHTLEIQRTGGGRVDQCD